VGGRAAGDPVGRLSPYLPLLRARSASLGDQLERALISVPLEIAEGAYSRGKNRQARYPSAAASAREALACLETAEALGWVKPLEPELGALFQQVIGTLVRLCEPRRRASLGSAGSMGPPSHGSFNSGNVMAGRWAPGELH
jgi:four helix bundle protein